MVTAARNGRDGFNIWLGPLRRAKRKNDRHAHLGASAPLKDLLKKFGFTVGERGCDGETSDGKVSR